ncbi:MAG: putative selenium-dependent hydroxylase accessory protein YqeC [Burkholderiales bacterium]|nr:putative selenium-dependent hydroxylase accessory protein YqeC [Anaerolineae bacterium]
MKLRAAFNIAPGDVVAFIGAGGKTSALMSLGHELADDGLRVLATTTTRISEAELELMPHAMTPSSGAVALSKALGEHRFVFLYDEIRGDKVYGPSPHLIPQLLDSLDSDVLLIEADNSNGRALKAPYEQEPVIPAEATLVVPVAGLSILGKALTDKHVYNPQAITERYGFVEGNAVRSPWVAQIVRDEELGLKGIPDKARVIALLNQTPEHGFLRARARLIARLILRSPRVNGVAVGSVRSADPIHEVQRPIGAIVLAAGMSTRMGQSKLLLPWTAKRTIIEHILEQLIMARLDHITVVTGHRSGEVRQMVTPFEVNAVYNARYKSGEMLSSLKAGLQAMPTNIAAALVVLGDQPRIQPRIINQVLAAYAEGAGDIVAPSYKMRRGHPILIDRRYWQEILALPDDGAPRDVIEAHKDRIAYVNVDTDSVLRDVDTPQDYSDERFKAGLT